MRKKIKMIKKIKIPFQRSLSLQEKQWKVLFLAGFCTETPSREQKSAAQSAGGWRRVRPMTDCTARYSRRSNQERPDATRKE